MHDFASKLAIIFSVATTGLAIAESPAKPAYFHSEPSELQFSDATSKNAKEEDLASRLSKGSMEERVAAAGELWNGHSRRHARHVLEFILGSASELAPMTNLKRSIDYSLRPEAISRELRDGDNLWGLWLACLRPHESLVPELLAELNKEPSNRPEVIFALGKSGDKRAIQPLLQLLDNSNYRPSGDAANALGYMAFPEVELKLMEALSRDNPWLKVKACSALGKVGSRRALPALQRIANDKKYTGALSVRSTAASAIEAITKRDPEQVVAPNGP